MRHDFWSAFYFGSGSAAYDATGPEGARAALDKLLQDFTEQAPKPGHVDFVGAGPGDPSVFERLDEELEAIAAHDLSHNIVPGITAASAAAASLGRSLSPRGRNSSVRLITGHHMAGFADHDWGSMAKPDTLAAIYMGNKAARFIQGRLMIHGADPKTPITIVENVSRLDQRTISTQLKRLPQDVRDLTGPAVLLYGVYPHTKSVKINLEQRLKICC